MDVSRAKPQLRGARRLGAKRKRPVRGVHLFFFSILAVNAKAFLLLLSVRIFRSAYLALLFFRVFLFAPSGSSPHLNLGSFLSPPVRLRALTFRSDWLPLLRFDVGDVLRGARRLPAIWLRLQVGDGDNHSASLCQKNGQMACDLLLHITHMQGCLKARKH